MLLFATLASMRLATVKALPTHFPILMVLKLDASQPLLPASHQAKTNDQLSWSCMAAGRNGQACIQISQDK
jgi:hypothetical protein